MQKSWFALCALLCRTAVCAQPTVPAFTAIPIYPIEGSVAVADVNGDGIPDLVAYHRAGIDVVVDLGNGDGTFRDGPTSNQTTLDGTAVAVGDFNGDGKLDVLFLGTTHSNVETYGVMLGNGDGTFTLGPLTPSPLIPGPPFTQLRTSTGTESWTSRRPQQLPTQQPRNSLFC